MENLKTKHHVAKAAGPVIDPQAWAKFYKDYFSKEGTVLKFDVPIATPKEAFDIFLKASNAYRKGEGDYQNFKLYLDAKQVVSNVIDYLPVAADGSLQAYIRRLDEMTQGAPFMIYVNNFEQFAPYLWERIHHFLQDFTAHKGIASGVVEAELFVGRYHITPGGVHRANCANFHHCIEGEKIFYVWAPEVASANEKFIGQKGTGSEEYIDGATLEWKKEHRQELRALPTEAIFCPSNFWHVGHSPEPCACVNIAMYDAGAGEEIVQKGITKMVNEQSHDIASSDWAQKIAKQIVPEKFKTYLKKEKLRHITSLGMKQVPAHKKIDPSWKNRNSLRAKELFTLQWEKSDNMLFYAVNGYVYECMYDSSLVSLLQKIKTTKTVSKEDLQNANLSPKMNELIENLLKARLFDLKFLPSI